MANTLPKHIESMVQKNNLVVAIKTLSAEKNISMDEAKAMIDVYESELKKRMFADQEKISKKQEKKTKQIVKKVAKKVTFTSLRPYFIKIIMVCIMGIILITLISKYM